MWDGQDQPLQRDAWLNDLLTVRLISRLFEIVGRKLNKFAKREKAMKVFCYYDCLEL